MSADPISRRRALGLLALGTASLGLGGTGWTMAAAAHPDSHSDRDVDVLEPGASGQPLTEPVELTSQSGVLAVQLTAAPGVRLAGRDTAAFGYNGTSPGPTLRVRPGDLLRIRLVNGLEQVTNLHTHGLHVSPEGNSDNPFVHIEPGTGFDYEIRVPADHPTGTFWYHPHHHGTVADQIFGGLAGALVVDGGPTLAIRERILLVADTTLDTDGKVVPVDSVTKAAGREGELVLVNGQHEPVITAAPGAVERWRIINACSSRVLALRLAGHDLNQVALDGRFLPAPVVGDPVVLGPGNRADLLVTPGAPGRYSLISDLYPRGSMTGTGQIESRRAVLATLNVTGAAVAAAALPTALPAPPPLTDQVDREREIVFAMGMGAGGMSFTIDGNTFDPDRDDQTPRLGTTEEWTVVNTSSMAHPFHLHTWPVQVLTDSTDGADSTDGTDSAGSTVSATRQDVVLIPPRGRVRLRVSFNDVGGRTVYHCHTLDHEDAGMMATINVQS